MIGAVIPVLPFFVFAGRSAVTTSMGVSAVALFTLGAAITLMTGRRVLSSGLRHSASASQPLVSPMPLATSSALA